MSQSKSGAYLQYILEHEDVRQNAVIAGRTWTRAEISVDGGTRRLSLYQGDQLVEVAILWPLGVLEVVKVPV